MVKLHCKYYTRSFSMWNFQVFVVSLLCMYLFLFLGMSKVVDTPSPHSSRKQKKCGSCHSFLTDLDPHPSASLEGAAGRAPALTVPPSHRTHGRNGSASSAQNGPLRPRRGPRGIQLGGGGEQTWEGMPRCSFYPQSQISW